MPSRRLSLSLLLLLCLHGCAREPDSLEPLRGHVQGMNVIIVLFDAASASHIQFLGYERATTPFLSELAEESFVFENAYAQASATPLSILALFTGSYPVGAELPNFKGEIVPAIADEAPTLASMLAETHPRRQAWSANRWVCEELGYAQGYTDFYSLWADSTGEVVRGVVSASYVREHAAARLDAIEGPFFSYLHFIEPHLPYQPPEPYASLFDPEFRNLVDCTAKGLRPYRRRQPDSAKLKNIVGLYDGNLAYADAELRSLLEPLMEDGTFEHSIFIFLSDHGEAFWEHGSRGHGLDVFDEVVRVPLMIRIPGMSGRRIPDVVELVDILPTVADLFAITPAGQLDGNSLLPKLFADSPADSLEQLAYFRNHESSHISGIREGRFKLIESSGGRRQKLYDLLVDPGELRDLRTHRTPALKRQTTPLTERLSARLQEILEGEHRSELVESGADSLDTEAVERLKAIGYFDN